ncbi:MAG: Rrf2 family transcriptional regulator [Planctomycetota bacterium]|nr:MAG: Rrf2 family transcriptional regulator [Planctomycetota bacterium]
MLVGPARRERVRTHRDQTPRRAADIALIPCGLRRRRRPRRPHSMLQLTKKTEYGLIALIHLADRDGQIVSAREIAACYPVPKRLMAEVLKELCQHELVHSTRGATGGYALARPAYAITLGEVVRVLEGMPTLASCEALGMFRADAGSCDVEPVCPIKSPIQRVRVAIWDVLQKTTLQDMSRAGAHSRSRAAQHPVPVPVPVPVASPAPLLSRLPSEPRS